MIIIYETNDEKQERESEFSKFVKKRQATRTKQKAVISKLHRGFNWWRKNENKTDYNRKVAESRKNE